MLTYCLDGIMGTARPEAATGSQQGAETILVQADQADEKGADDTLKHHSPLAGVQFRRRNHGFAVNRGLLGIQRDIKTTAPPRVTCRTGLIDAQ